MKTTMRTIIKNIYDLTDGAILSSAYPFSYRYRLWRAWDKHSPTCMFIMFNPSTANACIDDPTIRKCMSIAEDWGYGRLEVCNLYAYRSRDPDKIVEVEDPIGPDNDRILKSIADKAHLIVVAWGSLGKKSGDRIKEVLDLIDKPVFCIGKTKDGMPRHPLFVGHAKIEPYVIEQIKEVL